MINLPEGVTYLATEQYKYATTWGFHILGFIAALLTCLLLIAFISLIFLGDLKGEIVLTIFFYIGIIAGSIISIAGFHIKPIYKDQYLVTIDDSVSLIEFTQQYEIIDKNENIYTIREIEP